MRVATSTLYTSSISRINQVKSDMVDANTSVTSGKRINTLSDDPVAISSILNLRTSMSGLTQYTSNVAAGRQWLQGGETALSSVKSLITDAKTTAISMQNGIMSTADYTTGVATIKGIMNQILDLANTQVNGQYVFSGTKTNIKSFAPDNADNPTVMNYQGSETPFTVKMSEASNINVGYSGDKVFNNSTIMVDETNNKIDFREDLGGTYGQQLTAVIPSGTYTREQLAQTIAAVMTTTSASVNQPQITNVSDNTATMVVNNPSTLTNPTGGTPISLKYSAASNSWSVANSPPGYVPPIAALSLSSNANAVNLDFNGDGKSDVTTTFSGPVPDGYTMTFDISSAVTGGNKAQYGVNYDETTQKYSISQTGGPPLANLQMMWATGSNKDSNIAPDIGFSVASDQTVATPTAATLTSDHSTTWGIFNTLIDLQNYLKASDTAGINRTISRLSSDFDNIGAVVSDMGTKQNSLDIRDSIISDLNITYKASDSTLEDTDMISELTKLTQYQNSYNAALASTSKILQTSILNYL